jgi:glutaredoxin-like protein NrdH
MDKLGISYSIKDVTKDSDAMQKVIDLGFFQAPVVVVGEESWSGFRPDLITKHAK